MKQLVTTAIVLSRTNYGEADKIVTLLTPEQGKLTLIAKGVRRIKSKLAGGVELFSISHITYIQGRGEVGTLVSARLEKHYHNIVKDVQRTLLGYELIKQLNKATEDQTEVDYFHILEQSFAALDDHQITLDLIGVWFNAQLLRLAGYAPNLQTNTSGAVLDAKEQYDFDYESVAFAAHTQGRFNASDIKFLRLLFSQTQLGVLTKIATADELTSHCRPLVQSMRQQYIR